MNKISFIKRISLIIKSFFKFWLYVFIASILIIFSMRWINPIFSSIMFQRQIEAFLDGEFKLISNSWIDYDEVSKYVPLALIAAEDQNFPSHYGFDFEQIKKALKENFYRKRIRGASTISQQLAKNLFLWEGKSFVRKGIEAYFTLLIETLWDKKRILEVYMNIIELGDMTFGVASASEIYLKRDASKLTSSQAALIASVLPNPKRFQIERPSGYVRARQSWVLRQMNLLGGLDYLKNL
ncbi:MAG: monofunctional biosynthetic peptidoglycan transglycosylase [Ignavibacterium sp.]|nr:monofunctional biosynthetic peptidoglycan transglycosylase [Ignavibacterium sp.]